jgi:hypothetical protein
VTFTLDADMSFASDALEQVSARWDDRDPPDDLVLLALWHAAVVAYARCFGTGRRARFPVDVVPVEFRETHEQTLDLRNWVIAHPVSELESHAAGIEVGQDGSIGATRVMRAIPGLPSREFVERLHALVDAIGVDVFAREQALHAELANLVAEMSPEQRLALPSLGIVVKPGSHGATRR